MFDLGKKVTLGRYQLWLAKMFLIKTYKLSKNRAASRNFNHYKRWRVQI